MAREIRARGLVVGLTPAEIAEAIHDGCAPVADTNWIRAYRLALGISLADVVAQVRARYASEGRPVPRFSETLLSAYEGGQKRPGPEYLHYLCAVYRAEPADLGYPDHCFCGRSHREPLFASPLSRARADHMRADQVRAGQMPAEPAPARRIPAELAATALPAATLPGTVLPGTVLPGTVLPGTVLPAGVLPSAELTAGAGESAVLATAELAVSEDAAAGPVPAGPPDVPGRAPVYRVTAGRRWPGLPTTWKASRTPLAFDSESAPAGMREAEAEDDHDVVRRALLRMATHAASPVDGQFLGAVDRIRRRMEHALARGTVSATALDQWEETTVGYGRQYMTVPPLRLLCDVLLDLGDIRRMCEHRQPLEFGERLCRLAGQLAGFAGVIMIDVGDPRLARAFFRTARAAADETGDRHLRAWVVVREAMVPLYYGDGREAAALARTGAGLAGANPCAAAAMGPMLEARAVARMAAHAEGAAKRQALRKAMALVERAQKTLGRTDAGERGDTVFGYTERQILFHEGEALVGLGDHKAAQAAYSQALARYSPEEILDRCLVSFGLARCQLEAGEPEEALRLSRDTTLGVPREHRSQLVLRAARSLGEAVAGRHGEFGAVREYREALLSA